MKVVYNICCGVDVHKSFLVATIITTIKGSIEPNYKKKRFSTFNSGIRSFKEWLIENNCYYVCMESTGKYWIPVYNLLEDVIHVTIANPKWVKAVKGCKDDEKDSKWIGDLFRLGLVPGSFIPPKDIRMLREYTRYESKLIGIRTGEKNRFRNSLTVCNVALDSVVSDIFGKSATAVIEYLIDSPDCSISEKEITSRLLRSLKNKSDQVIESVDGYTMADPQKERMRIIRSHFTDLDDLIKKVNEQINKLVAPYENFITLLCTIPGVDRKTAIVIISEIGTDMSRFTDSKHLCSWAGLTPGNNESAGKKKSVKISRAGVYLKPQLVQAAHAAVKCVDQPYYANKYNGIGKRRGKKRAIIAIARMILTAAYHMLSSGVVWNPTDLPQIDMTPAITQTRKENDINKAIKLLLSEGILRTDPLAVPS
jgi:transposase